METICTLICDSIYYMGPYPSFYGIKQPRVWHFLPLLPYPFPPSSSLHQDGISVLHRVTPRISCLRVPQTIEHNEGMYELTFSYKKLEENLVHLTASMFLGLKYLLKYVPQLFKDKFFFTFFKVVRRIPIWNGVYVNKYILIYLELLWASAKCHQMN